MYNSGFRLALSRGPIQDKMVRFVLLYFILLCNVMLCIHGFNIRILFGDDRVKGIVG